MILLLRHSASDEQIVDLRRRLEELGFESARLDDIRGRALEARGEHIQELLTLRDHPAVEELLADRAQPAGDELLWPHGVLQLSILLVVLLAIILILIAVAPAGLGSRADVGAIAPDSASEWYMRPLVTLLRTLPPTLGGIAVLLLWIGLILWPFLDRSRGDSDRFALLSRILGVLMLVALIVFALLPLP